MSITSRGSGERGSSCATPKKVSRASSCPLMMSIGNPSVRSACARNSRAFFATRNVFVATTRTAEGCRPDRRSRNRARQASAASIAERLSRPLSSMPGAEAQRLAPRVELVDLVALDAADLEPEAVRSEVDDGQQRVGFAFAHAAEADWQASAVRRVAENGRARPVRSAATGAVVIWLSCGRDRLSRLPVPAAGRACGVAPTR